MAAHPRSTDSVPAPPRRRLPRRLAAGCATLLLLSALGLLVAIKWLGNPLPEGPSGAAADALATRMMAAAEVEAWQRTGAVMWDFGGRQQHLWDRRRQLARVVWGEHEVLLDLASRRGLAWRAGEAVPAAEAEPLLEQAWSHWCNDSFWLNPLAKLFDDGTERAAVRVDGGGEGLLVTYASGGVTPGDSYLWILGDDDLPVAWRMWTQILPVDGLEASWEGWIELETGARVATRHQLPIVELKLEDVRGAEDLESLLGGDPFAPLVSHLDGP